MSEHVYSSNKVLKSTAMERIAHSPWGEEDIIHALAQVGWVLHRIHAMPKMWPTPPHLDVELSFCVEFRYLGGTHKEPAKGMGPTLSEAISKAVAMATLTDEQRRGDIYYPRNEYGKTSIENDPPPQE